MSAPQRLAPCPARPNCVSTLATDAKHAMPAIAYTIPSQAAVHAIMDVVAAQPRARVVSRDSDSVHAEFRSRILGFVDDVELVVDQTTHLVHFRSASRVGRRDFGVNRRRMTQLTQLLQPRLAPSA